MNFDHDDDEVDQISGSGVKEALLRESGHLTNSERLLDEQYDLALRTRENLMHQRSTINSMKENLIGVTSRFILVNDVIKRIKMRRKRDTIIVAIVSSICLGFLVYYLIL